MTDAEKREKVIRGLERFINNYERYITDWEPVTDALALLKEQEPKREWIPVTERLPKTNEKVLVYVFDPDFCGPYIEFGHWLNWLKRWGEFDDEVGDFGDYTIIAWMPLPEPPKEADNDNH